MVGQRTTRECQHEGAGGLARAPTSWRGLGVKKLVTKVDDSLFEQAPAEVAPPSPAGQPAAEEAPAPAGSRFNMDALEEKKKPAAQRGKDGHLTLNTGGDFFSNPMGGGVNRTSSLDKSPTYAALSGSRGGGRGGAGSSSSTHQDSGPGAAQQRFGNAKSISSSAFFNDDQKESNYEQQQRLAQFQGQGAISSDAYFGREDRKSSKNLASSSSLDVSASELVQKISLTAKQDLGQVGLRGWGGWLLLSGPSGCCC